MICTSKKNKHIVESTPPTQPQSEPAIVVDKGPIQVLNDKISDLVDTEQMQAINEKIATIIGDGSINTTDLTTLSAKLDKLIAYLEKWCQVGNISMNDIREHLS